MGMGHYVQVSPDLELYYEEVGTGPPLIFIPGWTGTTEFFVHQIPHFARNYRVLAYDPRSQGQSSKTLENNHYTQHGKDLQAFIEALNLQAVTLVGWSWGCHDVYAYFRAFGTANVKACILIDQTPRSLAMQPGDWAEFANAAEVGAFLQATTYNRRALMTEFFPTMITRAMSPEELDFALDQVWKTPTSVATLLAADGAFADYTMEAQMVDSHIAVLHILSEDHAIAAQSWLAKNAPHADVFVLGKHMMFWEFPDQFNAAVDRFLAKVS